MRSKVVGFILLFAPVYADAAQLSAQEIIRRSVEANQADWKAAPDYAFTERDVATKRGGPKTIMVYRVMMVEGSFYQRLIAVNDQPLSKQQDAQELRKLRKEAQRRQRESADERARRISKYQKERNQDQAMLREMAQAMNYKLAGEETDNGRQVWVLDATPKAGYQPKSRETRVLTGMRGRLWVDQQQYQWVKVEAEVIRPVTFGFFLAKVGVGTKFVLEQAPAPGGVWLPVRFSMTIRESVLGFGNNSSQDETYRDYQPNRIALTQAMAR